MSKNSSNPYESPHGIGGKGEPLLQQPSSGNGIKLFVMMVLQFFIWGAWLPQIFAYLPAKHLGDWEQFLILSCFPVSAIIGMFFSNQFADRNFSAERFLAFSHLVGGLAMLGMAFVHFDRAPPPPGLAAQDRFDGPFWMFFGLMAIHCLLYVPTISVTNAIAFSHMKNSEKEFGIVRMGGTIGWILAAWPIFFVLWGKDTAQIADSLRAIFIVSGLGSLALAGFSLLLPHTPPNKSSGVENFALFKALTLLGTPAILILFIVTFIDATIHNGYFVMSFNFLIKAGIPAEWVTPVMSIGQVAEILTMMVLGAVLANLGWRWTLIIGILGHAARFTVFALMPESKTMIILVQLLHGICYAFFFATVYIYIDKVFPKDIRTSAQGLFNFLILGVGDLAAKFLFIKLSGYFLKDGLTGYRELFLIPVGMAIFAAILLLLFFHPPKDAEEPTAIKAPAH